MRKFIIEIHPDGTLTCCEYEDSKDAIRAANDRAWLDGYRRALTHCNEQVNALKGIRGNSLTAALMYEGADYVRKGVADFYRKYMNDIH